MNSRHQQTTLITIAPTHISYQSKPAADIPLETRHVHASNSYDRRFARSGFAARRLQDGTNIGRLNLLHARENSGQPGPAVCESSRGDGMAARRYEPKYFLSHSLVSGLLAFMHSRLLIFLTGFDDEPKSLWLTLEYSYRPTRWHWGLHLVYELG